MEEEVILNVLDGDIEIQKKYVGKHVAIIDGKIAGWGNTSIEVFKMAREKFLKAEPQNTLLRFIPQDEYLIL
jgi:hypothetical protein